MQLQRMPSLSRIRVAVYTEQPFVALGLASGFCGQPDLELVPAVEDLAGALRMLASEHPDVLLVNLECGISLQELREIRRCAPDCRVVLWGQKPVTEFASQAIQLGVRGIIPGSAPVESFVTALRNIHMGLLCFEKELMDRVLSQSRVALTARQGQIVSLVAQGMRNKEIAYSMGITEGTVKVYLYKLFKKLGTNDRLELALYGLRHLFSGQPRLERNREHLECTRDHQPRLERVMESHDRTAMGFQLKAFAPPASLPRPTRPSCCGGA
jgi:DNA-binding NarL/FixJ family response regulator